MATTEAAAAKPKATKAAKAPKAAPASMLTKDVVVEILKGKGPLTQADLRAQLEGVQRPVSAARSTTILKKLEARGIIARVDGAKPIKWEVVTT